MLIKIFSLYIQSLKDRTLAVGQSQIYDLLLITIMTIPILSFAIFGLLVVLKA